MFKFNVKHVASSSSFCLKIWPKVRSFLHTFCWLIKSPVFCIFHFIPRMFSSFTQHCCFPNIFHPRAYVVVGQRVWGRRVGQHYHLPCLENVRNILSVVRNMAETRLTYNCAHPRSTKESLTFGYDI